MAADESNIAEIQTFTPVDISSTQRHHPLFSTHKGANSSNSSGPRSPSGVKIPTVHGKPIEFDLASHARTNPRSLYRSRSLPLTRSAKTSTALQYGNDFGGGGRFTVSDHHRPSFLPQLVGSDSISSIALNDMPRKESYIMDLDRSQRAGQDSILDASRSTKLDESRVQKVEGWGNLFQRVTPRERGDTWRRSSQENLTLIVSNGKNRFPEHTDKAGHADTQRDHKAQLGLASSQANRTFNIPLRSEGDTTHQTTMDQHSPLVPPAIPNYLLESQWTAILEERRAQPLTGSNFPTARHKMLNRPGSHFSSESIWSISSIRGSKSKDLCTDCRKPGSSLTPLVPCKACREGYHTLCGNPKPRQYLRLDDFTCGICSKEQEATASNAKPLRGSLDGNPYRAAIITDPDSSLRGPFVQPTDFAPLSSSQASADPSEPVAKSDQDTNHVDITPAMGRMAKAVPVHCQNPADGKPEHPINPAVNKNMGMLASQPVMERQPQQPPGGPALKQPICRRWEEGFCKWGDTCPYTHSWTGRSCLHLRKPTSNRTAGFGGDNNEKSQPAQGPKNISDTDELPLSNGAICHESTAPAVVAVLARSSAGRGAIQSATEQQTLCTTTDRPAPVKRLARRSGIVHSHHISNDNLRGVTQTPTDHGKDQQDIMKTQATSLEKCESCGKLIQGSAARCARCTIKHDDLRGDGRGCGDPRRQSTPITISDDEDADYRTVITISDDEDTPDVLKIGNESDGVQPHTSTSTVQQHEIRSSLKHHITEDSLFAPRKKVQLEQIIVNEAVRSLHQGARKNEVQAALEADTLEPHVDRSNSVVVLDSANGARAVSPLQKKNDDSVSKSPPARPTTARRREFLRPASARKRTLRSTTAVEQPGPQMEAVVPLMVPPTSIKALINDEEDGPIPTELVISSWITEEDEFTQNEHDLFVEAYSRHPKAFPKIAELVGRTVVECVRHYYATKHYVDYKVFKKKAVGRAKPKASKTKMSRSRGSSPAVANKHEVPVSASAQVTVKQVQTDSHGNAPAILNILNGLLGGALTNLTPAKKAVEANSNSSGESSAQSRSRPATNVNRSTHHVETPVEARPKANEEGGSEHHEAVSTQSRRSSRSRDPLDSDSALLKPAIVISRVKAREATSQVPSKNTQPASANEDDEERLRDRCVSFEPDCDSDGIDDSDSWSDPSRRTLIAPRRNARRGPLNRSQDLSKLEPSLRVAG
ncbi:uncharacterized protein Z520_06335 [Fonsecaea multimorphosa CBS 102226]|uniref:PHD-type domain-containing protein n=1 Tax=Fonsecaea multimorphosa CBS 102226 TaxID=1442371 RepID=A0A0D2H8R7_9EURO|nr:uncharacterized protein Z520_06335 [Fonsecaea multimorphosa CBS 102226]KIX98255.1 hypothetical protein Z520_06335 [Fonsecaea multimorphosa CBS 102226]OAL22612.1 hypothetical protein AYO22_07170 [Fonsecaea multimorphosa]